MNKLRTFQNVIGGLLEETRQNTNFQLDGVNLRNRLQPVTNILRTSTLTPQQERKLLDVFGDVGAVFSAKNDYFRLLDDRDGNTFFITYRDGQLFSGKPLYFDGPTILAALQNMGGVNDDAARDAQLRRAIAFITSEAGNNDQQSRQAIFEILTGPQGLTDFASPDGDRFTTQAWRQWLIDFKPVWHGEVRRYIRSGQPLA
jgi:hypothetical protein